MEHIGNLLIVDDEKGMQETLSEILIEKGYTADTAGSGTEALEKISKDFFNVVLLDIKLPDTSGIEVLKKIKQKAPDTEVVMITAYASLESSINALNEGAYAYILKPFDATSIFRTVKSAVERQTLIKENRDMRIFNEMIVQNMKDGILIEDETGVITFANPQVEKTLGLSENEILGNTFGELFSSEQGLKMRENGIHLEKTYDAAPKSRDVNRKSLMVTTTPMYSNDQFTGLLSVLTDVTQLKESQNKLNKTIEELERFNRLMVGRELKIAELKKKIAELEKKAS